MQRLKADWPTVVQIDEAGGPSIPLHHDVPQQLTPILPIRMRPEAEQRAQRARAAVPGSDVHGVILFGALSIDVGPVQQQIGHALCMPLRPAERLCA